MTGTGRVVPPAGWLPDPVRPDVDRYWDGSAWTAGVRSRETGEEWWPGGVPSRRGGVRRRVVWAVVLVGVLAVIVGAGWRGALPGWVPWPDALERTAPSGPEVAYPVFGSDDLVTYLARSMVAQEEVIDLSWMAFTDADAELAIPDAISEAVNQNPYVFVEGWEWRIHYPEASLSPIYTYDAVEAERRRGETALAVELLRAQVDVSLLAGEQRDLVAAAHDLVVEASRYDVAASDAVLAGETTGTSELVARSQEAYGALVEGTAVCNGYAQAFLLMADAVGLESVIVTGVADGGVTSGLHAWNLVRVGDEWLVVDTTWDDAGPLGTQRDYLLVSQGSAVLETRTADAEWMRDDRIDSYGP